MNRKATHFTALFIGLVPLTVATIMVRDVPIGQQGKPSGDRKGAAADRKAGSDKSASSGADASGDKKERPTADDLKAKAASRNAPTNDGGWPKTAESGTKVFTVYQPQLKAWDGIKMDVESAVAVNTKGSDKQTFGVGRFTARTIVDKDARLVTMDNVQVTKVNFPSRDDDAEAYKEALQKALPAKAKVISLDRVEADLGTMKARERGSKVPLKNKAPRIIFKDKPAILVFVDGKPVYRPFEKTGMSRLINTRPLVLKDAVGIHFIHVYDGWLKANSLNADWGRVSGSTKKLDAIADKLAPTNVVDLLLGQPTDPEDPKTMPTLKKGRHPSIIVTQEPTTLVVTDGPPKWAPLSETKLLYIENTTGNVFREMADQQIYVLESGRWFRAPSTRGPWQYVPGTKLPKDFAAIPDTSAKENAKASVPGTRQAREAMVSNSVPEVAAVDRKTAKMTKPHYDGKPQLKPIEGTKLQYVANTATPVIRVDPKSWYAVDKGIWFTAPSSAGPWELATSVPEEIYTIPPSSPLHYVTYVKIYEVTETTIYEGYTPGYTGTVVTEDDVVAYGTGYEEQPWVGEEYYAPAPTYGYGAAMRYDPYCGWCMGYGFGYACGEETSSIGYGCYPWWGAYYYPPYYYPPGYYAPPAYGVRQTPYGAVAWGPGGVAGTTGNVYHQWGDKSAVTRRSGGYNANTGNVWRNQVGMSYNSTTGQISAGQRAAVRNVNTGDFAAMRQGATRNPSTGGSAAGRQGVKGNVNTGNVGVKSGGVGYNSSNGNYAAGQKATIGNANTGQSATVARGTVGNPSTGTSIDYRGVQNSQGAGVAQIGNATVGRSQGGDVYAGGNGNVYRQNQSGGWSQYNPGNGTWVPVTGNRPANLPAQAQARQYGQVRAQNYANYQRYYGNPGYGRGYGGGNYARPNTRPPQASRPAARPAGGGARGGGGRRR